MQIDTGQFEALRAEVAELAAKVELYHQQAITMWSFDAIYWATTPYPPTANERRPRPRHLRAVDGAP
jgi:hypothetical protein